MDHHESLPEELLRATAALALQIASPKNMKPVVLAGQFSASKASRWRKHGFGPLGDLTVFIWHLAGFAKAHAHAIVAHLQSTLMHRQMQTTDAVLQKRYEDLSVEAMVVKGRLKDALLKYAWPYTECRAELADVRRAALEAAACAEELAAVCLELERRGLEPRDIYEARRAGNIQRYHG